MFLLRNKTVSQLQASQDMHGSRELYQRGSNFDKYFFLIVEGKDDQNTTISRPLSAGQRNAI